MKEKQHWKGACLISPLPPAMVSCGTMEQGNIITIGWTGILNTIPPVTYISVRPERHSFDMIKEGGDFVINLTPQELVYACDWCGVKSGKNFDKFKEMSLTKAPSKDIKSPIIAQCPINIECKVRDIIPLGSHYMFMADIVGIQVDDDLLDEKGRLDIERANLIAYAHGTYFQLGKPIGTFGYSVKKPTTKAKEKTKVNKELKPRRRTKK